MEIALLLVLVLISFVIILSKRPSKRSGATELLASHFQLSGNKALAERELVEAMMRDSWDDSPVAVIGQSTQSLGPVGHAAAALTFAIGNPRYQEHSNSVSKAVVSMVKIYGTGQGSLSIPAIDHESVMIAWETLQIASNRASNTPEH
ncbi:hypothetical protein [Parasphingorhabdus cellanae]|uniref:Uncharacterized protein n=1 Tax=Parasphingorhabdus cellanae TaxID=2806553 RepID=A0ABX7T261_9SPHN|nr:hypothetical protein [Parasphingorhabdus cellanae]QTD54617.1 hypothetical protein J4G78_10070 [Parasphingorhabdus cellanae]